MKIEDFVNKLEEQYFSLVVDGVKLVLKANKDKVTDDVVHEVKNNREIVDYLRNNKEEITKYIQKKQSNNISSIYGLSGLQSGMLFENLYDSDGGIYQNQMKCDLIGVNLEAFRESWQQLLSLHSILRSSFNYDTFNIPVQCVHRHVTMPVEVVDYSNLSEIDQEAAVRLYEESDRRRRFDFSHAPLMRVTLLRLSDSRYRMLWSSHHILYDGWSMPILMIEFLSTYDRLVLGMGLIEQEEDCYEDYIRYIEHRDKEEEERYWRNYLKGVTKGTSLPFITASSKRVKGEGDYNQKTLDLDNGVTERIDSYTKKWRITVNTLMQGVWSYLLHQYTNQSDITYGVVVSGRPEDLPGIENRVGLYINTLPLHSVFASDSTVINWLQELQESQFESRKHQYSALSMIQSWSGVQGDLFDSILVFQNYPISKVVSSQDWKLKVEDQFKTDIGSLQKQFDYPLYITIKKGLENTISVQFLYNTLILDPIHVDRIRSHFENILLQILEKAECRLGDLELLSKKEQVQLLEEFNDTKVDYPKDKTLVDLFSEQVIRSPESVALVYESKELSYRELDERSNQLGHYLRGLGVGPEVLVPICIERSPEMIVGILGILKSGGAYVPIDPDYPIDRIRYMLSDTGGRVVIGSRQSSGVLRASASHLTVIELDGDTQGQIEMEPVSKVDSGLQSGHLAYVIYTSGSTGKPKGVMVEHRSLLNYLINCKNRYVLNEEDYGSFVHLSYTFDASITSMFVPLISGRNILVTSNSSVPIIAESLLNSKTYDFVKLTPGHMEILEQSTNHTETFYAKNVVIGGEALHHKHIEFLRNRGIDTQIINEYGPTEATVGCTFYCINASELNDHIFNNVPIGKPFDNTCIYILNDNYALQAIGVVGEIYIGGAQVARGYLNNQTLTNERFIVSPFINGDRLYRTGDMGRWLPDGNIEFLGRRDHQIKVRGYRVELGEIENVLKTIVGVKQAVIIGRQDSKGSSQIIGYVVKESFLTHETIIEFLESQLPGFMIPVSIFEVNEIPLTKNGKIDKDVLLEKGNMVITNHHSVTPINELEKELLRIWQDILEIDHLRPNDDFFKVGGDSLLAIRLISTIRKQLKVEVSLSAFFEASTFKELLAFINTIKIDAEDNDDNYETIKL